MVIIHIEKESVCKHIYALHKHPIEVKEFALGFSTVICFDDSRLQLLK